jgi:hypothetical protein
LVQVIWEVPQCLGSIVCILPRDNHSQVHLHSLVGLLLKDMHNSTEFELVK